MHYQPKQDLLQNRIILVTGATDGIGAQAALTYARYGAELILLGRNKEKLSRTADAVRHAGSGRVHYWQLDLDTLNTGDCQMLAHQITLRLPRLDGVLHNAGVLGDIVPMINQVPEIWQQVMRINVDNTFFLTQALLPLLLKSDAASLVFTTSSVGRLGRSHWGAYAVSKFATEGMMQVLAEEYRDENLRVNCINPGATRTKMRASAFPNEDAALLKTPEDIMPLYLYLMGDDSRRKTGISFDAQPHLKPGAKGGDK